MARIKILTLFIIVLSCEEALAKVSTLEELYLQLDAAIEQHDKYVGLKNEKIRKLRKNLAMTRDKSESHRETWNLYKEYSAFDNDSAIAMLNSCISLARDMGNNGLLMDAYMALVQQYANTGAYSEGEAYLQRVDRTQLDGHRMVSFLLVASHLYGEMGYYTQDKMLRGLYYRKSIEYRDSCYAVMDRTSVEYMKERVSQLTNDKKLDEAMRVCDLWMNRVEENTHDYAIMAYLRSEIYKCKGDIEKRKYWLAVSALCDVRNAIMDQAALWSLAELLGRDGDIERSDRYVEFSWDCTRKFNTHLRSWLVSPILSLISSSYKKQLSAGNTRLKVLVAFISLLMLVLSGVLLYVSKKRKQLAVARNDLKEANEHLTATNSRLHELNEQLSIVNSRLNESNHVKDEYIGEFLSTCSAYVDKLDNYRIKINRKLKSNQIADLLKITGSGQLKDEELKSLFANFDTIFLRLFPTFVDDFNKLLREDSKILPPQENTLTTDLRIFALIRLGIEESSRIAEFLRYSPNSIYNYRARIKNKAVCGRDEFEQKVKQIGTMKP